MPNSRVRPAGGPVSAPASRQGRIYLLLAFVNVLGAGAALWTSHSMMANYESSVVRAGKFAERLQSIGDLSLLAGKANEPGNDVFESKDPSTEEEKLSKAVAIFREKYGEAQVSVPRHLPFHDAVVISQSFAEVGASFAAMQAATGQIFAAFRAGDTGLAAQHMAAMDARFGEVRDELENIRERVQQAQALGLAESLAVANQSRFYGDLGGAFMLVIVLGVMVYGLRLASQFTAAQKKIAERNRDMRLVLDNAEQGFLTVSLSGALGEERSAILDGWFGAPAPNESVWKWLGKVDERSAISLEAGWTQLQEDWMPLDLALDQLPRKMRAGGRVWALSYRPIVQQEKLSQILLVISDVTAEDGRRRMEQGQRDMVSVIERIMRDRFGALEFIDESKRHIQRITQEEARVSPELQRSLHTLKGNAALYGMQSIADLCHNLESRIEEEGVLPSDLCAELATRWEDMMYRLEPLLSEASQRERIAVDTGEHRAVLSMFNVPNAKEAVRRRIEAWEHEPVKRRFSRLGELARSLGTRLGRAPIEVHQEDGGIRLPADRWSPFWAALVHAVRNAVDHGVETAEERAAAGKPVPANLFLTAKVDGNDFTIELKDDGRGIDWAKLSERAKQRGLPHHTRNELLEVLFMDGISTRDEVSDLSGRGIGMGALRASCLALQGSVELESQPGKGTLLRCRWDLARVEGLRWIQDGPQRQAS